MKKNIFLLTTAIFLFCMVCITGCSGTADPGAAGTDGGMEGQNGAALSDPDGSFSSDTEEKEKIPEEKFPVEAAYSCELGSISIRLPEGWSYTIEEYDPEADGSESTGPMFGIRFYPEKTYSGIAVEYWDMFGVCGTGLEETETTINGMPARTGVYDNSPSWSFIVLTGEYEGYVILNESGAYGEQVNEILETLVVSKTASAGRTMN